VDCEICFNSFLGFFDILSLLALHCAVQQGQITELSSIEYMFQCNVHSAML